MESAAVLLVIDTQFVEAGVYSDALFRRHAPGKPKLPVNPYFGIVVRIDPQCDELTARRVPIPLPPGAEEPARQPRVVVQEVEGGAGAQVVDERRTFEVAGQPDLPTKARLLREPLIE